MERKARDIAPNSMERKARKKTPNPMEREARIKQRTPWNGELWDALLGGSQDASKLPRISRNPETLVPRTFALWTPGHMAKNSDLVLQHKRHQRDRRKRQTGFGNMRFSRSVHSFVHFLHDQLYMRVAREYENEGLARRSQEFLG